MKVGESAMLFTEKCGTAESLNQVECNPNVKKGVRSG